jgi:hypothetical protein
LLLLLLLLLRACCFCSCLLLLLLLPLALLFSFCVSHTTNKHAAASVTEHPHDVRIHKKPSASPQLPADPFSSSSCAPLQPLHAARQTHMQQQERKNILMMNTAERLFSKRTYIMGCNTSVPH